MANSDTYHGVDMREMLAVLKQAVKLKWRFGLYPNNRESLVSIACLRMVEAINAGTFDTTATPMTNALLYLSRAQSAFIRKETKSRRIKERLATANQGISPRSLPIEDNGSVAWAIDYLSAVVVQAELSGNRSRLAAATYYRDDLCGLLEVGTSIDDIARQFGISRQIVWKARTTLSAELLNAHSKHFDYRPTATGPKG